MSKLKKILVKARRQVFSEMVGNNPSMFRGDGYDFVELREYMSGDDIRHIDWNITAKMQKPFVKVFKEERELNVVLVSTLSGSMYFGSKKFKQDIVAEIVALLGFSVLKNGDILSSYIFSEDKYKHTKSSKSIHQVHKNVEDILNVDVLGKSIDYKFVADTLYKRIRQKSLVIVIGDFFEIPDFRVLAKKHEVIAVILRDKLEEKPPQMGFTSLLDPENGASMEGDFNSSSVDNYAKKVQLHDHNLYQCFKKDNIRFTKVYTDSYVSVELRRLFEGR